MDFCFVCESFSFVVDTLLLWNKCFKDGVQCNAKLGKNQKVNSCLLMSKQGKKKGLLCYEHVNPMWGKARCGKDNKKCIDIVKVIDVIMCFLDCC